MGNPWKVNMVICNSLRILWIEVPDSDSKVLIIGMMNHGWANSWWMGPRRSSVELCLVVNRKGGWGSWVIGLAPMGASTQRLDYLVSSSYIDPPLIVLILNVKIAPIDINFLTQKIRIQLSHLNFKYISLTILLVPLFEWNHK